MDRTEQLLTQTVRLLTEIRDELRASGRAARKEADRRLAESRMKERQMRKQMMLVEAGKRMV